uniref:Uncharacterized protein n=1 Tax=Timema genevievae TaxID=629358 RepID=A0A7R9K9Y6_TIMGE|nr:unnamed protein product [Timema genevievae]
MSPPHTPPTPTLRADPLKAEGSCCANRGWSTRVVISWTCPVTCSDRRGICGRPFCRPGISTCSGRIDLNITGSADLSGNLFRSPWDLRPAVLPARNINMFWKNRSQYHRLSEYGTRETFEEVACPVSSCSFRIPIPGRD